MISRCLGCGSPIFHNKCTCGNTIVRCPDCDGSGRQKTIELINDDDGYMGYVLKPQKTACETCKGLGRVSVRYNEVEV